MQLLSAQGLSDVTTIGPVKTSGFVIPLQAEINKSSVFKIILKTEKNHLATAAVLFVSNSRSAILADFGL